MGRTFHQSNLQRRIDDTDGAITIKDLRGELAARGHRVPYRSLRNLARNRLEWPDAPAPTAMAPSVRTVVVWITHHPETLTEDETTQLKTVLDACPELDQTHTLVRDFAQMFTGRTGADLLGWISTARAAQPCRGTGRPKVGRVSACAECGCQGQLLVDSIAHSALFVHG
ncbi:hypothetical protein [Streptomyces sp. SAS_260]|uniref:hypothetical protein n=1 Tax=Streptomyces sp. SAS_260 TaxID=3412751 RepID=UPI00403D4749